MQELDVAATAVKVTTNKMFDDRCGNHSTIVNPKINSPHFPLIQKSASGGAKTLPLERSIALFGVMSHDLKFVKHFCKYDIKLL